MNDHISKTKSLAKQVIDICIKQQKTIIAAESMTGGLLISELTGIPNASKVIDRSIIVYSDQSKMDMLGVPQSVINHKTAYSEDVVRLMVEGLSKRFHANIHVAISGIAGPKTHDDIPVGTVYIGLGIHDKIYTYKTCFKGDRSSIRHQCVQMVFQKIIEHLKKEG